jgi:hypothetical protein
MSLSNPARMDGSRGITVKYGEEDNKGDTPMAPMNERREPRIVFEDNKGSCKEMYEHDIDIRDNNRKKFIQFLKKENNPLLNDTEKDISQEDLKANLYKIFDNNTRNYHFMFLYDDIFVTFIKNLRNILYNLCKKSNDTSGLQQFNNVIKDTHDNLADNPKEKRLSLLYVSTLAKQNLTNINCVYFYDFLLFNGNENQDHMFATEPNVNSKTNFYNEFNYQELSEKRDVIFRHIRYYNQIENKKINEDIEIKDNSEFIKEFKDYNWGNANDKTSLIMMKSMVASYLIFILTVMVLSKKKKKDKELNELLDINISYLEKSVFSLEDCISHSICFYKLYYHPLIFNNIKYGSFSNSQDSLDMEKEMYDVEKLELMRRVVCYDENLKDKYMLKGESIVNSINQGNNDNPVIDLLNKDRVIHLGNMVDNLHICRDIMKSISKKKHNILMHNVDNCFDIENIFYMHNRLMGLTLEHEPIMLYQEMNSMNIQDTLNVGKFFYKDCTVINGNLLFTDKHMYNIYSGDTVRYGDLDSNGMYVDIESKFEKIINESMSYKDDVLRFYELMSNMYKNKKSSLENFYLFANDILEKYKDEGNSTFISKKLLKICSVIKKVKSLEKSDDDNYKYKFLKRLLVHNCRNTAKSVTGIYYGDINYNVNGKPRNKNEIDNTKLEHFLYDVYTHPILKIENIKVNREYVEKGSLKVRKDDVFNIKNAKLMIHELKSKSGSVKELNEFYNVNLKRNRSRSSSSSDNMKRQRREGGGIKTDYYYIYCDERLNILDKKKDVDTTDKNKKLLTIFPSSFYDPKTDTDSKKNLCLGVLDVLGENKNHVFLAIRGKMNGNDTCIVNVHFESGGQMKEHLYAVIELKRMLGLIIRSNERWFNDIENVIVMGDFNLNSNIVVEVCYDELKRFKRPNRYCKVMFDRLRTHTLKTNDRISDMDYTTFMSNLKKLEILVGNKNPSLAELTKIVNDNRDDSLKKWYKSVIDALKNKTLDEYFVRQLSNTFSKAFDRYVDTAKAKKGCIDNAIVLSKSKVKNAIVSVGIRRSDVTDISSEPYIDISEYSNYIIQSTKNELLTRLKDKLGITKKKLENSEFQNIHNLNTLFFSDHSPILLSDLQFEDRSKSSSDNMEISVKESFSIS